MYVVLDSPCVLVYLPATYLLMISSPDIDSVAMSLYDVIACFLVSLSTSPLLFVIGCVIAMLEFMCVYVHVCVVTMEIMASSLSITLAHGFHGNRK